MKVFVDKVGSVTRNLGLGRTVHLASEVKAEEGAVVAVRIHGDKSTYNQLEDVHGRLVTLHAGDIVVGVGNIYASEALFLAGIRPTTRASHISRPRAARLHAAIREVLARAVQKGGSTLRDFSNAQGESGYFQLEAMVYGREGEPCRVCGTPVRAIRQGQRSTFYCPHCQRP